MDGKDKRIEQLEAQVTTLIAANAALASIAAGLMQKSLPAVIDQNTNILSQEAIWARTRINGTATGDPIPPCYMTTSGQIVQGEVVSG